MHLIWIVGLALMYFPVNFIAKMVSIPRVIIYMVFGIILGTQVTNILPNNLYNEDFIKIIFSLTLIITLIKGMLVIDFSIIKKNKGVTISLSFIPVLFEVMIVTFVSLFFFGFTSEGIATAFVLGLIVAPVSPAIVIPALSKLIEKGVGKIKGIPSIQLLASSLDDIFSVVVFYIFMILAVGAEINPLILLGTVACIPIVLTYKKVKGNCKYEYKVASILRNHISALTFIMLGALFEFNIKLIDLLVMFSILLVCSLLVRAIVIYIIARKYNIKERNFIFLANIPRATVQATLGPLPMIYGMNMGYDILSISILYILITAPIGAILLDRKGEELLNE